MVPANGGFFSAHESDKEQSLEIARKRMAAGAIPTKNCEKCREGTCAVPKNNKRRERIYPHPKK